MGESTHLSKLMDRNTDETRDVFKVSESGGIVSDENSTIAALTAGSVFTGSAVEILSAGIVFVVVKSDVASAVDGLSMQQSIDGVNWDHIDNYTVPAGIGKNYSINPCAKYFRVVYTNGGTNQAYFRLQTIVKANAKPSSHRIQDSISTDDDAELVKAVITGETNQGNFVNFSSTNQGNLRVALQEYGDTPAIDAFGRLRTSNPYTLFDSKQLHDKQPLFWDESLGGSATSTHNATNACTEMVVTADSADFVIRQTKQRLNYQPGKSQLVLMTFRAPHIAGLTMRIGLFDGTSTNNLTPKNGFFLECNNSVSLNIAKNGTITETVTQANWNFDKMDGTGFSEKTLDFSAPQILVIDYEWLGVGRVRMGFVIDGLIYYCHYFNHANNPSFTSVYTSTPNLPLRYSIETDGTAGGQLDHICSTVMSEGGVEENGILKSIDMGITSVTAAVAGTTYALIGVRLKSTYNDVTVLPKFISMISETPDGFRWSLLLNPTIAGTFTYGDLANSSLQAAIGVTANTISNEGFVIDSGYAPPGSVASGGEISREIFTSLRIGSTIAGVADELVLAVTPLGANAEMLASLTVRELL